MKTAITQAGRPAYFTVKQAAWMLGVSPNRVHRAIRTGTLPAVRRHSRYEVPETALKHLLTGANDRSSPPPAAFRIRTRETRRHTGGAP